MGVESILPKFEAVIAHALENKLAVFHAEQLFIKVPRPAEVGDVVAFIDDFAGRDQYITPNKHYRVRSWHGLPAIKDDADDIILVYEQDRRTLAHVNVYAPGSIEQIYTRKGVDVNV